MIDIIIKRDGRRVSFDPQKITDAIMKAFQASNSAKTIRTAEQLTRQVLDELEKNEAIGRALRGRGAGHRRARADRERLRAHRQELYTLPRRTQPASAR